MRYRCILTFRTTRSKTESTWRTIVQGEDFVSVTAKVIAQLERRQKRKIAVVGMYLQVQEQDVTA